MNKKVTKLLLMTRCRLHSLSSFEGTHWGGLSTLIKFDLSGSEQQIITCIIYQ